MRMKSILAISALSAGTFFAGFVYAAPQPEKQTTAQENATEQSTEQTTKQTTEPSTEQAATLAPAENEAAQNASLTPSQRATTKKSSAHHKKHRKHRKHHRHHRHHRHHYHHPHHRHCHTPQEYCPVSICVVPNNFLLGGSLGYVVQKENFITNYTAPVGVILPIPGYTQQSVKITEQGVLFGLLSGWQWRCQRWMLGIEGSVDFSSDFEKDRQFTVQELNGDVLIGTVLYERGTIYSLSTRAGYFVTPFFMPYVRAGAQMSRDEVNYQAFLGLAFPPGTQVPDFSSRKKDVYGFVLGIGAEFPTYIGASTIRFEYNFVRTDRVIIEDGFSPILGNHKFRYPESHIGKIAWIWNFL